MQSKATRSVKKKRARLHSRQETEENIGDENTVAAGGIAGHMAGAWGPPQKLKPLKSKNAMAANNSRPLDEYDE